MKMASGYSQSAKAVISLFLSHRILLWGPLLLHPSLPWRSRLGFGFGGRRVRGAISPNSLKVLFSLYSLQPISGQKRPASSLSGWSWEGEALLERNVLGCKCMHFYPVERVAGIFRRSWRVYARRHIDPSTNGVYVLGNHAAPFRRLSSHLWRQWLQCIRV